MAAQHSPTLRLAPLDASLASCGGSARFLVVGDATAAPVHAIIPDPGVALPPRVTRPPDRPFRLHILHINDLHGRVSQVEHPDSLPVLSRIAGRLAELRRRCQDDPDAAVLMLSAGDELAGSAFDDGAACSATHPVYHLYSRMGVDVVALGNHDLGPGVAWLAGSLRKHARFPVLAANLAPTPALAGLVHPAALLVTKGVRVGIVGLLTPAQAQQRPPIVGVAGVHPFLPGQARDAVSRLLKPFRQPRDFPQIAVVGQGVISRPQATVCEEGQRDGLVGLQALRQLPGGFGQ